MLCEVGQKIHGIFSLVRNIVFAVDQIRLIVLKRRKIRTRVVGNGSMLSRAASWTDLYLMVEHNINISSIILYRVGGTC
jgi:hypothetical protein